MKPIEYAEKYLGEFKIRGAEIVPKYCPFCLGGRSHDQNTFALNMEKETYNCQRGSCNVTGHFSELLREKGEHVEKRNMEYSKPKKEYKPQNVSVSPAKDKVEEYLRKRGFSKETWEARGVGEKAGVIVFPYYEDGELVLVKYRRPEKFNGKGQKAWREEGGKPVFWGMDECNPEYPLIIVEGEFDALALDEVGAKNVVSVPSGNKDLECVNLCWDWLNQFNKVVIWPDSDDAGQEMANNLIQRIGAWRCWLIETDYKDANEALYKAGKEGVIEILNSAREVPISGLIRLSQVKHFDPADAEKIQSSIAPINMYLSGYMMGLLTVVTGINGSGKSTFYGQELLNAIDQGYRVCAYSGELPAPMFRFWIDLQAAGPRHLEARYDDRRGEEIYKPKKEVIQRIRDWYNDSFFLHDSFGGVNEDRLLEVFEYAFRRYNCKLFLVDNLMTTNLDSNERDFYRRQSNFVGKLKEFAHTNGTHVVLVAHPRKTEGRLTKMDIMGSGDITNRPDNVFGVHRFNDEEKFRQNADGVIDVFKNRIFGKQDIEIFTMFDEKCKRFYVSDREAVDKDYGWILS